MTDAISSRPYPPVLPLPNQGHTPQHPAPVLGTGLGLLRPFGTEDRVTLGGGLLASPRQWINPTTLDEYLGSLGHNREIVRDMVDRPFPGPEEPQVAVIDRFAPIGHDNLPPEHGDRVINVLKREGELTDADILQVGNSAMVPSQIFTLPGEQSASERVDRFIEVFQSENLQNTTDALDRILEHGPESLTTINQSQGLSELGVVEAMARESFEFGPDGAPVRDEQGNKVLTDSGRVIFEGLGVEADTSPENVDAFLAAAVERTYEVHQDSPMIADARERHEEVSQDILDSGINYVVAAGNDGDSVRTLAELDVNVSPTADDNLLSNPHNVTVGAFDSQGTATTSDDVVATFSSDSPEVDFLADGVDVPAGDSLQTGTSFAAPDVAAELANLARENPEQDALEVRETLRKNNPPEISGSEVNTVR